MTTQDGGFCMAMIGQHILDGGLTYVLCMISSLYSYFLLISRKLDNISASTWTKTGIFWPSKYRTYIHLLTKERLDVYPYWMLLKWYPIFMCLVGIRPLDNKSFVAPRFDCNKLRHPCHVFWLILFLFISSILLGVIFAFSKQSKHFLKYFCDVLPVYNLLEYLTGWVD